MPKFAVSYFAYWRRRKSIYGKKKTEKNTPFSFASYFHSLGFNVNLFIVFDFVIAQSRWTIVTFAVSICKMYVTHLYTYMWATHTRRDRRTHVYSTVYVRRILLVCIQWEKQEQKKTNNNNVFIRVGYGACVCVCSC